MNFTEELKKICIEKAHDMNMSDDLINGRLLAELQQIDDINESEYFYELYNNKSKFEENENNLLVAYVLGLAPDINLAREAEFNWGDLADVDVDFIPKIRDIMKEKYCRKEFGEDKVCGISTYTKFGIRSALIDMARVLGLERNEILALTTDLSVKDDEGESLTWDKAIELYDGLRVYLEEHPDLADAAKRLLNRTRGIGLHASGLIISGVPLREFVPLVKPRQNGQVASAWVEGLSGSDLGSVGLVKFDFLGLDTVQKNAEACWYAKMEHTAYRAGQIIKDCEENLCALPGRPNWSDPTYLNDPDALAMADRGELKMIFQFDGSPGIRKMAVEGGVTDFNDLVAYTSLFRPAAIKMKMHDAYCNRKRGKERYDIHPVLDPILGYTYGVIVYQEQCLRILNVVGGIPLKDCEIVRKAISKKKIDKFKKYKDMFIKNGQKVLDCDEAYVSFMWDQIEAFSYYSFNLAHAVAYTCNSMRQLYLKRHRPTFFFPSFMNNMDPSGVDDYLRIKEYLQEIRKNKIKVERVQINKSQNRFSYGSNTLFYPYEKIKGIGPEQAKIVCDLQPYKDYQDFLERFGTDAKVNYALIALRAFPGLDPVKMLCFYEAYKEYHINITAAWKKYEINKLKVNHEILSLTGVDLGLTLDRESIDKIVAYFTKEHKNYHRVMILYKKYARMLNHHERKTSIIKPEWDTFECGCIKDTDFLELLMSEKNCEMQYLGFQWINPIEEALGGPSERTFEDVDMNDSNIVPVEVIVDDIKKNKAKNGTEYYTLEVSDVTNRKKWITIWQNDYNQFKEELTKGNILNIRVKKPEPGAKFKSLNLEPTKNRWQMPKKENDYRIVVIKWADRQD